MQGIKDLSRVELSALVTWLAAKLRLEQGTEVVNVGCF